MSTHERKSDVFVEGWQETIRFLSDATAGSPVDELLKDHIRARDNETAQALKIAALEAELARLRPSGQVAEDERLVRDGLSTTPRLQPRIEVWLPALARITAKAKGYESAVAGNAALFSVLQRVGGDPNDPDLCDWRGNLSGSHREKCIVGLVLAQTHPGAALLEQHRKELVRARNEAMERVAKRMESLGAGPLITSATLLAKNVRAMMEPES